MHGPMPSGTVLAHGCFDLIHLGHVRHLQEAKSLGSRLVVSVTSDRFVRKGVGRPHFTAEQRMEMLRALGCVDDVLLNDAPDASVMIRAIRPDIYVKGIDYDGPPDDGLRLETEAVEAHGGRLHITHTDKWSSSRLLNNEQYPEETLRYLDRAKSGGFRDAIFAALDRADRLKLAFVGETIIDEYRYVRALGKASKEFMLATVQTGREEFEGGILAAAKHMEWKGATVITAGTPIRKTRFVDADFTRKIFEVYSTKGIDVEPHEMERFNRLILAAAENCEGVIAMDFGHGLIGLPQRTALYQAEFLAVNAQTNAGNFGYNPVTNYLCADMICVDDPEARLATRMQRDPIDEVVLALARKTDAANVIVTHGRNGCVSYANGGGECIAIPAFVTQGVDTMGAGDAFLATAAPLVCAGLGLEAAAFAGNVAGAIKVSIVGHRRHVTRDELMQSVDTLLK